MSVVGLDPDAVALLAAAMRRAIDELTGFRSADPAAASAVATFTAVRRTLTDRWEPVVRRALLTGALTDTGWSAPELGGLDLDGWLAECRSLGEERLEVSMALVDDPENAELRRRLDLLDATLVLLAERYADGPRDGHVPWRPTALDRLDPYTAALLLPGLGLDDHRLGTEAARLLVRERDGDDHGMPWPDTFVGGANTGDLVMAFLADRPVAAGVFLDEAARRPDTVFRTAESDDLVAAVLVAGTDPSHTTVTEAGRRLVPLLSWELDQRGMSTSGDGVTDRPQLALAGAIAPWLVQFGARADDWGWDPDDADEALRWVVDDGVAVDRLTAALATWRWTLGEAPLLLPDGRVDLPRLDDLTAMVDQVGRAVRDATLDDLARDRFFAEAGVFVATLFVSAVVPGGVVTSMAADAALDVAIPLGTAKAVSWGLLPSADDDERSAASGFGSWSTDAAVAGVLSVADQAIAAGRMPADALDDLDLDDLRSDDGGDCAPEVVDERLRQWVRDVAPRCDPVTANALAAVLNAFTNRQTIGQACGR